MKRLCVFLVLILAATGLACGSREVTIERDEEQRELSPEEKKVQEHLQNMMQNPMAPPKPVQGARQGQ